MVQLKITSDPQGVFNGTDTVAISELFAEYRKHTDNGRYNYATRIPMPSAIEMITEELNLSIQYL